VITVSPVATRRYFCVDLILSGGRSPLTPRSLLSRIKSLLRSEKFSSCQLAVVLISDPLIRRLNKKFMKKDRPTDVLAFDLGTRQGHCAGDVIVSMDTARRMARTLKISMNEELWRYIVHGILHLSGYDDTTPLKRKKMWARQEYFVYRDKSFVLRSRPRSTS
jgi:probable rRNA maturation factor